MDHEIFERLREALAARELVCLATVVGGTGGEAGGAGVRPGGQLLVWPTGAALGDLGSPRLNQRAALFTEKVFQTFAPVRKVFEHDGGRVDLFFDVHPPPPRLVVVGAVHVAIHLVEFAGRLGFETVVVDPRTAFATPERFAGADRLLAAWPQKALPDLELDESTYVAVLSHDLKIDVPALVAALASPARYVGALGSKKTHGKRVAALEEAGVSAEAIARVRAPIGIDLGGRRAEEIALAIMAEIVAASHGR